MKSDQANSFQRVEEAAAGAFDDVFMDHRVPGTPHNSTLPTRIQHRAATAASAAPACVKALERRRSAPFDVERVVDENLRALFDRACCPDEDPIAFLFSFTVRRATVINPTRGVATLCAVDHASVVEPEEEGVSVFRGGPLIPALCLSRRDDLALVLEDYITDGDSRRGEHTTTMNRRVTDGYAAHD